MPAMKQLRIGFLTSHDPMSRRAWSSTIYSIYTAVKKHWGSVTSLGPVSPSYETLGKTCNTFCIEVGVFAASQMNAESSGLG